MTPPDPQLKGAWYPGCFNPCTYQAKNRFQDLPFKFNLRRYITGRVWENRKRITLPASSLAAYMVGLYKLNPADPQLETAW